MVLDLNEFFAQRNSRCIQLSIPNLARHIANSFDVNKEDQGCSMTAASMDKSNRSEFP
jgi:hypothetical protein